MKLPLYLQSLNKCWAGLKWDSKLFIYCVALYTGFFDDVTGVSRKLRGSFAEAAGWVWEYLATPSLPQYQDLKHVALGRHAGHVEGFTYENMKESSISALGFSPFK